MAIGAQSDGLYKMQGAIDDVRLYNRALSASEIATLFALAKTPQSITFGTPPDTRLDESPVTLGATADSGLPVAFSSLDSIRPARHRVTR